MPLIPRLRSEHKYNHKYLIYKEEEPYIKDSSPFFIKKFYFYLA